MLPIAEDPLVRALAEHGAGYDAEPAYPADCMALLERAGLHRRYAPVTVGGESFADEHSRYAALRDDLRRVGRGDLSTGRLYEGHVNALLLFEWYASAVQLEWLAGALDRGAVFGVWATEAPPGVGIVPDAAGYRMTGAKRFASGAGGIDYAVVTARPPSGERRAVVVAAGDATRTDASGWRVRGMRASMSGEYDLSDMVVGEDALLGAPGAYDLEPRFTAGAWRFTAVQLGGIEALLAEVRAGMSDAARADPLSRAAFGAAVVATRTAFLWVREAAEHASRNSDDAIAMARMARGVVERAGLDVMEHAARLIGTRSAFDGGRIDRITRDLSLYLRQAGPDHARDAAVVDWLVRDRFGPEQALW
ncbi:acyl-CoA dehydrogenase [Sphingomonas japonica]|uniref:Alkylation response protein AidB-like acyl-CoA dehydrogenase n=1 Tax=Sphingomonas japonica TaxID=511662 RepID=A0ABX0U128_9SPHN|nr:acyl-CoA dehydrogenase [Sphingomonas japonica]NIJ23067.1 alkylation response protein AidB-like acyl-CoA dehydrogenase [Sphingomonas japonica]